MTENNPSEGVANKVVRVTLAAGIIGWLASSPSRVLNSKIQEENALGWNVVQILPADSGNFFLLIVRVLLLFCTFFLYTTTNGYYLVLEKMESKKSEGTGGRTSARIQCSRCGCDYPSDMKGFYCDECGNKL